MQILYPAFVVFKFFICFELTASNCSSNTTLILALRRQPEDGEAAKRLKRNPRNQQEEETMRRFMVHLVTEIDFVDGDEASDVAAQNYQKHLKETIQNAAQGLSLHTIRDAHVESVSVAEIKAEL